MSKDLSEIKETFFAIKSYLAMCFIYNPKCLIISNIFSEIKETFGGLLL